MEMRILPNCAYCDKPLRLIAGFCSACTAPANVAQRAYSVADARRRASLAVARHSNLGQRIEPSRHSSVIIAMQHPQPRWLRYVTALSVIAFAFTVMLINLRATGSVLPLFQFPTQTTLAATIPGNAATQTRFAVGQQLHITYSLDVPQDSSILTISITPQHGPKRSMTERVAHGTIQRTLPLVPLVADIWQITLELDDHKIQSLEITVYTD